MERLINAMKRRSATLDGQTGNTRAGQITSVGPDGTTARVAIQPEGNLSGWLPVGHVGVGANSIIAPPNIGDWVLIEPHEDDAENWIITKRLFNTSQPPPNSPANSAPVKPGEFAVIVNNGTVQGGSYLHFTNDGTVHLGGTDIKLNGTIDMTGTVNITGNVAITGTLTVSGPIINHGTTLAVP